MRILLASLIPTLLGAQTGPYLGQTPPGTTPKLFAPGVVSTGLYERDFAVAPEGREFFYLSLIHI